MRTLALIALVFTSLAAGVAGCSGEGSTGPNRSQGGQASQAFEGLWVSASGTTEVVVRALGGDEFELKATVVMDRKDRRFDQVRTHLTRLVGRQFLAGSLPLASLNAQDQLVFGARTLQRSPVGQAAGARP